MTLALPRLPYDYDGLEPFISTATLKLHHGVHHQGYLDRVNALVRGTDLFKSAALAHFGSGWVWLLEQDGRLCIEATANADNPLGRGGVPLLVVDVWEHAYYLDYQARRAEYLTAVLDHLLDWSFAERNLRERSDEVHA